MLRTLGRCIDHNSEWLDPAAAAHIEASIHAEKQKHQPCAFEENTGNGNPRETTHHSGISEAADRERKNVQSICVERMKTM